MPDLISPAQPIKDIAGLAFEIEGVKLDIAFFGEVFEMEDQRNWSDASFKTYCRPLVEPFAYMIPAGSTVRQEIRIKAEGALRDADGACGHASSNRRRALRSRRPKSFSPPKPDGCPTGTRLAGWLKAG